MGKASKDKRDAYYRLAKEQGWRARSAFKLLQLDEEFNLFEGVTRVVDLCAAPGSWSQVLSRVLIKGERFGRAGWDDRQAHLWAGIHGLDIMTEGVNQDVKPDVELPASSDPADGLKVKGEIAPRPNVKIVAIDLQPMTPLEGITTLKADITHPSTIPLLLKALDPDTYDPNSTSATNRVDLVISDGAPDVTGLHDLDIYVQSQLLFAALNLALCVLKPGGRFVAKIFRGKDVDLLYAQLKIMFDRVQVAKPRSSRASSIEAFVVCEGFSPPDGFKASMENPLGARPNISEAVSSNQLPVSYSKRTVRPDGIVELESEEGFHGTQEAGQANDIGIRWIAPFLACGDLSAFDADATHHLPQGHESLDPVQPPTAPPYKRALEMRKAAGGAYGKTSS